MWSLLPPVELSADLRIDTRPEIGANWTIGHRFEGRFALVRAGEGGRPVPTASGPPTPRVGATLSRSSPARPGLLALGRSPRPRSSPFRSAGRPLPPRWESGGCG